jgi:hypothetical protein
MPSVEGMREHLAEVHAAELLKRSHVTVPVSANELRRHFLDTLSAKELRIMHAHLHRDALREVT